MAWEARQVILFDQTTGTVTDYIAPDPSATAELAPGRLEFNYTVGKAKLTGRYPPKYPVGEPRLPYPVLNRSWRVGEEVVVYYDPTDASVCTLDPRIDPFPLVILMFLAPFVAFVVSGLLRGNKSVELQNVGRGTKLAGGTAFWPAYFILSVVAAFAFAVISNYLSWPVDLAIGILLPTVFVPVIVHRVTRWTDGSSRPGQGRAELEPAVRERRTQFVAIGGATLFWWMIVGTFLWRITIAPIFHSLPALVSYHQTQGQVVETRLDEVSTSRSVAYRAVVVYAYKIDNRDYRASRISFAEPIATPEAAQRPTLDQYAVGSQVVVHYDPNEPSQAVLDLAIMKYQLCFDYFLVPFVLIGALLLQGALKGASGSCLVLVGTCDARVFVVLRDAHCFDFGAGLRGGISTRPILARLVRCRGRRRRARVGTPHMAAECGD